ncbi:MAG: thioesterase family protein [Cyclobacteriaceae bacterium]
MARVTLILPEPVFSTDINIHISDINYGGHLGNDRVLTLMHEARLRFLKSLDYKDEISIAPEIGIIVSDSVVIYRSEAFHGDKLKVSVGLDDFNAYGMDIFYKLENSDTGKEVARGKTGIVFFNYVTRKIARIPDSFRDRLDKYTEP